MSAPAAGNGHRNLRSFRKDKRQCTTELPIRAIPPTISPEGLFASIGFNPTGIIDV
jgi:hypothetical protein